MRLYLNAKSKNNVGYVPDWLKVTYKENGVDFELTLDIQGEIDYDTDCLNCRCKGDLIPWVLYNTENGDEIVLSDLSEEEVDKMFSVKKVAQLLKNGRNFRIGIYPENDSEESFKLAAEDVLSECAGLCELFDGENSYEIRFEFEEEFNG